MQILRTPNTPKIVVVASAIELGFAYGCTPAWWQLWKALHRAGADVLVTPYRGRASASMWWRTAPNPCRWEGEAYERLRKMVARLQGDTHVRRSEEDPHDSPADRVAREVIWRHVTPRWSEHLTSIVERERDVSAVIVFGVPMSHLRGIPTRLRERFAVPVVYYDPDVPMSLPEFGGMDTGFNIYHGADPREYDLVLSNSEGGLERLRELGARRVEHLFWGADPDVFAPQPVEKQHDVFFYGYGRKFRQQWLEDLIIEPSNREPGITFVVGGSDFGSRLGNAQSIGYVMPSQLPRAISAARINVNVARRPHASVYASSTSRLFELAAAGATIVTNPYLGVERWFEPGSELLVVGDQEEAVETYRALLDDPTAAAAIGHRARERVLDEHTALHRAQRLLGFVGVGPAARAAV